MKHLYTYISEKLNTKVHIWLQNILASQQSLIVDNKVEPIIIDIKALNKPEKPFNFNDFFNDAIVKTIVNDKLVGFKITNELLRKPDTYIFDKEKNIDSQNNQIECMPYWYKNNENIYFIGLVNFDKSISHIDNYVHLINIDTSLIVSEPLVVCKAMLNDFSSFINTNNQNNKYLGITVKPVNKNLKTLLLKLGFQIFKDNKNILIYKF